MLLPVILFSILRLVNSPRLMGDMVNGPVYNVIARATTAVVTVLSVVLLVSTVLGWFGLG
jgi:Mn2+/Fe2+ NRAMP family transporter